MDCHRTLFILVLTVCSGCVTTSNKVTPTPLAPLPPPETPKKEKKVIKQQPKPETCVTFGQCFESLATEAEEVEERKIRDKARLAYQQALQLDPKNLEAWLGLGRVYSLQGDYQRAQDIYQKGLAKFPKEPRLWHDQGLCHARVKKWSEAIASFQKAVDLAPENRHFLQQLGFCLARAGQADDSVACLTMVMGPAQAHYQVARMMQHLKKDYLSQKHLQLALEANPRLEEARQMLALVSPPSQSEPTQAQVPALPRTDLAQPQVPPPTQAQVPSPVSEAQVPALPRTDPAQPQVPPPTQAQVPSPVSEAQIPALPRTDLAQRVPPPLADQAQVPTSPTASATAQTQVAPAQVPTPPELVDLDQEDDLR